MKNNKNTWFDENKLFKINNSKGFNMPKMFTLKFKLDSLINKIFRSKNIKK